MVSNPTAWGEKQAGERSRQVNREEKGMEKGGRKGRTFFFFWLPKRERNGELATGDKQQHNQPRSLAHGFLLVGLASMGSHEPQGLEQA